MQHRTLWMGAATLALLLLAAGGAEAENQISHRSQARGVTVVTRPDPGIVTRIDLPNPHRERIEIVHRKVTYPGAVVPEALAEQPTFPHLIELVVVNTPILIDPDRDLNEPPGVLDENHYLRKAQRVWKSIHGGKPARVIRSPRANRPGEAKAGSRPEPSMILQMPGPGQRPAPPHPEEDREPSLVRMR